MEAVNLADAKELIDKISKFYADFFKTGIPSDIESRISFYDKEKCNGHHGEYDWYNDKIKLYLFDYDQAENLVHEFGHRNYELETRTNRKGWETINKRDISKRRINMIIHRTKFLHEVIANAVSYAYLFSSENGFSDNLFGRDVIKEFFNEYRKSLLNNPDDPSLEAKMNFTAYLMGMHLVGKYGNNVWGNIKQVRSLRALERSL